MLHLSILGSKERKEIGNAIKEQWGMEFPYKEYNFFKNKKGKIFISNKCPDEAALPQLRINSLGLYFGQWQPDGFRLSIEGSQIVGAHATKNIVEVNEHESEQWVHGDNITFDDASYDRKLIIGKTGKIILGCAKVMDKQIHPYFSKARRVFHAVD